MSTFCVPPHLIEQLKASALKGEVDIKKIYDMSPTERRAYFEKYTNPELSKFINTEFEKAMVSKSKKAITDWAKSVFSPTEQKAKKYKNVLDKIKQLDEMGVLNPKSEQAFLQDLVAEKLGIAVSPEEIGRIGELAGKIDAAQKKVGDGLGDPTKLQDNVDFFKAKKEMDDYLLSLTPANRLKILTSTIGRAAMLASIKSPILNIGSNTVLGITEAMVRRLGSLQLRGTDTGLAMDYVKMVNKIYKETGYDISRMRSIEDMGESGARVLGETTHSQGPGVVRAIGRVAEDVVFKTLMGAPDAAFASAHFADSVNLGAMKLAKGDRVKARRYMKEAMKLGETTNEGAFLREQAILDAETATWTNKTWGSRISLGLRNVINDVTGDVRLGDQLFPFVKTPANVVATGMDYAGMGIPKAIVDTVQAIRKGDVKNKSYLSKLGRDLARAGFGLTAATIIAAQFKDDDFVGAYDPARSQIETLRNSNTNSIRIGDKWVSADWLGPLAPSVMAILYARKYGGSPQEKAFQYSQQVAGSFKNLPVVKDVLDTAKSASYSKGNQTLDEMVQGVQDAGTNYLYSRLVPSFLGDIAKATDQQERKTGGGLSSIQAKIPGLRQQLPVKKNILGEDLTSSPWWSDIIFGARVKTDKENAMIKELSDVATANDKGVTFTDWDKSNSATLRQFKEQFPNLWESAKENYSWQLKTELEKTFANPKYQELNDEDKLTVINGIDAYAQAEALNRTNFKYQKIPKKKIKL